LNTKLPYRATGAATNVISLFYTFHFYIVF